MTRQQHIALALQDVTTPADAFALWPALEESFPGCSLMLASSQAQAFKIPAHRVIRHAHLLSGLAADGIFLLNHRIFREMESGRPVPFPVDYTVSFDTSAASFLRSLFAGGSHDVHTDFLALLQSFNGNRLNWDIEPYLWENAAQIKSGQHSQEILETALASERLAALDTKHFLASGQFQFTAPESRLEAAARKHISDFVSLSAGDWGRLVRRSQLGLHAGLLKLTLLHLANPKPGAARQKTKALLRFMDEDLSSILALLVALACERFSGGRRAGILDRLQPGAKNLIQTARNIAWDIFHRQHMYQQACVPSLRAEFLVPCFLTFDKHLAAVFDLYPIKACLVDPRTGFPQLFPATSLENLLRDVSTDTSFVSKHLTAEASQRRADRVENQPPDLEPLVSRLEAELGNYDATAAAPKN